MKTRRKATSIIEQILLGLKLPLTKFENITRIETSA